MLVTLLGAYAFACSYVYLAPSLPSTQAMRNVEMQVPLRVYTRNGGLIAQIGEQRRIPKAPAHRPWRNACESHAFHSLCNRCPRSVGERARAI